MLKDRNLCSAFQVQNADLLVQYQKRGMVVPFGEICQAADRAGCKLVFIEEFGTAAARYVWEGNEQ